MPQTVKIISSAKNINDVPEIARMVKQIAENIRSKPSPTTHISNSSDSTYDVSVNNNINIRSRIREILSER